MGTDIHGVFQRKRAGGWSDIPSRYAGDRHYQLFAALAGVRNGTGFAGVRLGEEIGPIVEPRGLPRDFAVANESHPTTPEAWAASSASKYTELGAEGFGRLWMGDHTHSWLTSTEILAWAERAPIVRKVGVIDRAQFAAWDKKTAPAEYCGGISGPQVLVVERQVADAGTMSPYTHVRVSWYSNLRKELAYFLDEVARLQAEHGEVRFVFGFDS